MQAGAGEVENETLKLEANLIKTWSLNYKLMPAGLL